jgi:septation ring formation regulator EzrA
VDSTQWIILAVVIAIVVIALLVIAAVMRRRRSHQLQNRFGPEYDRALEGNKRRNAERDLADRADRRDELDIRPLSNAARQRYTEQWQDVQARFVDRPESSVNEADDLIRQVMEERGYPVDDFDERANLVSVDHPDVVDRYRDAHSIAQRNESREASTEDLRRAVVEYRSLFEALVETGS